MMKRVRGRGAILFFAALLIVIVGFKGSTVVADAPTYNVYVGEKLENYYTHHVLSVVSSNNNVLKVAAYEYDNVRFNPVGAGDADVSIYLEGQSVPTVYHFHVSRNESVISFIYKKKSGNVYAYEVRNNTDINYDEIKFNSYVDGKLDYKNQQVFDMPAKSKAVIWVPVGKKKRNVRFEVTRLDREVLLANGSDLDRGNISLSVKQRKKGKNRVVIEYGVKNNTDKKIDSTVYGYIYDSKGNLVEAEIGNCNGEIKANSYRTFKRTIYVDNYNGKKLKIKSWVNSLVQYSERQ